MAQQSTKYCGSFVPEITRILPPAYITESFRHAGCNRWPTRAPIIPETHVGISLASAALLLQCVTARATDRPASFLPLTAGYVVSCDFRSSRSFLSARHVGLCNDSNDTRVDKTEQ